MIVTVVLLRRSDLHTFDNGKMAAFKIFNFNFKSFNKHMNINIRKCFSIKQISGY